MISLTGLENEISEYRIIHGPPHANIAMQVNTDNRSSYVYTVVMYWDKSKSSSHLRTAPITNSVL